AVIFGTLGLLGAWRHWQADRRRALAMTALVLTFTLLLIFYLNFKYGFSQMLDRPQLPREVRERDYFFLGSFALWGVWVGMGLATLMEWLAEAFERAEPVVERRWLRATPVLLLALIPLWGNHLTASRKGETLARDFAWDMLQSVEPYGVLITAGDNDTFPLWYAQEVEGIRKDVIVACTSLLNTDWYVRQIIRRPLYDYDAAKGPAIYRNQHWVKPTEPPIHMTMAEADAIPEYYQLAQPMVFEKDGIHATIDPRKLEYGVLQRSDLFVLRMIQDAWPERPIYFARSSGSYARSLGMGDYTLTQGLASKLILPPAANTAKDTVYVQGDGW